MNACFQLSVALSIPSRTSAHERKPLIFRMALPIVGHYSFNFNFNILRHDKMAAE